MKSITRKQVFRQGNQYFRNFLIGIGVLLLVHVVPKGFAPRSSFRLICMIAFFVSAILMCWQLTDPRSQFVHRFFAWRFADAPQAIERTWRRYLYSIDRLCRIVGFSAIAFLASNFLYMLALWFYGFSFLLGLNFWVWWISLACLILLPFVRGDLISEVFQRRRQLEEQIKITTWYQPRDYKAIFDATADTHQTNPVEVSGPYRFMAGGQRWHWEDFKPNAIVFGQSGSGKTVCVLNALFDGLLASTADIPELPAGLILDPKGAFKGSVETLCKIYGRKNDLLLIDPNRLDVSIRWNPFDSNDDELELASRFAATLQTLGMKQTDSYWIDSCKKFMRHAIKLIRLTNANGLPPSLQQIGELASSDEAIVERTNRLDVTNDECDQCLHFFANEWICLDHGTKSGVQSTLTNMIDPFLMEPYASMFSGRSTIRVENMVKTGKILYVNMPIADKEAMSRVIGTFVKLEFNREVLKAVGKSRHSFFLCDEFQSFFTVQQGKGDADFFERSRESNHINLIATQNIPALLKQSEKKEPVLNLLGNCAVKIFLRNTDSETNDYASKLFGHQLIAMGSASAGSSHAKLMGVGVQGAGDVVSSQDQQVRVVPPEQFVTLAIPSREHEIDYCESITFMGARPEVDHQRYRYRWKVHPI